MSVPELTSRRLVLRIATPDQLRADLVSARALSEACGWPLATDWPPQYWEPEPVKWALDKIGAEPDEPFWRPWFVRLSGGPLIGTVGHKGPPDANGYVEVGYTIVTSCWRQGYASEALATLIHWVASTGRVRGVCAHTLAGDPASSGVLRRNGFALVSTLTDPDDGEIDRYELILPAGSRIGPPDGTGETSSTR